MTYALGRGRPIPESPGGGDGRAAQGRPSDTGGPMMDSMNLDAYFRRIGYDGDRAPTLQRDFRLTLPDAPKLDATLEQVARGRGSSS